MKKIILFAAFLFTVAGAGVFGQTTADEWKEKADEYFKKGDYANAITAYSETIKRNSSNLEAYWLRGIAYHQLKNYDKAIADCNMVINGAPNFSTAYISRGDAYGAKGVYHKAIADFKTGLEKGFDPSGFSVDKSNKADMWFCGAMYMETVINRFLGNSANVTKYDNWLKTVCDKNKVTRAEVETFYRNNIRSLISDIVDEEFGKEKKGDRTLIQIYADLEKQAIIEDNNGKAVNGITLIKETLTNFLLNPSQANYESIRGIYARYQADTNNSGWDGTYARTIRSINEAISSKMITEVTDNNKDSLKKIPSDKRFNIFSSSDVRIMIIAFEAIEGIVDTFKPEGGVLWALFITGDIGSNNFYLVRYQVVNNNIDYGSVAFKLALVKKDSSILYLTIVEKISYSTLTGRLKGRLCGRATDYGNRRIDNINYFLNFIEFFDYTDEALFDMTISR